MRCRPGYEVGMAAVEWTKRRIWMREVAHENKHKSKARCRLRFAEVAKSGKFKEIGVVSGSRKQGYRRS